MKLPLVIFNYPLLHLRVLWLSVPLIFIAGCRQIPEPRASFVVQPRQANLGDTVFFTNKSTDYTSVLWDFGDGKLSTEVNTRHIYTKPGDYFATLTVSRKDKSNASILKITLIEPKATVKFTSVSGNTFHLHWISDVPAEWKLNDSLFYPEMDQDMPIEKNVETRLVMLVKGTDYALWDTTLAVLNAPSLGVAIKKTEPTSENSEKVTANDQKKTDLASSPAEERKNKVKDVKPVEPEEPLVKEVAFVRNARVSPNRTFTGNAVMFSCDANTDVEWDFNGESRAEIKQGTTTFNTAGLKTIILKQKDNGKVWKTFSVNVTALIPPDEIARDFNKLANEGMTREAKKALADELYAKCPGRGNTNVTGKENLLLRDFVTKMMIESSEFVKVTAKVELLYDKNGRIAEIQLVNYDKKEIE
jgi:hypothetical protein